MNQHIVEFTEYILKIQKSVGYYFILVSVSVFLVFALVFWLLLKSSFAKIVNLAEMERQKTEKAQRMAVSKKDKEKRDRRMYLNLISVLQRDGRLIDFFSEDLSGFEDEQIGAAVRGIHENCKKTIDKYLSLKPVIDQGEGEEITIQSGFDPSSIKLTGNVAGEPPFTGVLKHRGWQVTTNNLPELSDKVDSKLVAPAEVEIKG